MLPLKLAALACVWICVTGRDGNGAEAFVTAAMQADWTKYKNNFGQNDMFTPATEPYARYYYSYNTNLINRHNTYEQNGRRTFTLGENKFTSMRLMAFNALFPKTTAPSANANTQPVSMLADAPEDFDPREQYLLEISVEDQGVRCNSGWAYAVAKSVELMRAMQLGSTKPERLSAQGLIDCAGRTTSCKTQVPQSAFDYLTVHKQELNEVKDYPNTNSFSEPGMCLMPATDVLTTVALSKYECIADADDEAMKRAVATNWPVVIEFDPTSFEFMHYKSGVFQQPARTRGGSHFMTVIGYGTDAARQLDYWLVLNSFGVQWGEDGFIRILRNDTTPLAKSACYPTELL